MSSCSRNLTDFYDSRMLIFFPLLLRSFYIYGERLLRAVFVCSAYIRTYTHSLCM